MIIGLHEMYAGETAEIVAVAGDHIEINKLKGMGIREGKLIELRHCDPLVNRKIVLSCDNMLLAFDISLSAHIRVRPLKEYFNVIKSMAHYDQLTGCLNRHATSAILSSEFEKFTSSRIPMSLLLTDIDHFKQINDTYGHPAGDTILRDLAALMKRSLRRADILCRWGGEEFLILLRGTMLAEARQIAERVKQMVEAHVFPPFAGQGLVTVSIGGCGLPPSRYLDHLIEAADAALYTAKKEGRNRVKIC